VLIAIATAIPMANHSGQSGILDEHAQRELEVEPGRIHPAVRPRIAMPFLGLLDLSTERPPCRRSRLVGGEPSRHVVEFPWETRGGINPSQPIVLGADRIFVRSPGTETPLPLTNSGERTG
jgi:hypothetical protein